ncbi:MAG: hypothetical protein KC416_10470, partial [Myxococcales bacterium]|nr:hypothetical protein [Myxococcales bacterium]
QQNFTSLARQKREVHFTVGHGERSDTSFKDTPEGTGTTELASALRRANVTMKNLGISQGLANEVPEGAPAVLVVGPRTPFLPEENGALERYIRAGGRVVIMVDPQDDHGLSPLLESFHLSLLKGTLASETNHTRRTFTPADRGLVFTKRYSSHPTVTLASRHQNELATVFVHGGAVSKTELEGDGGGAIQFPIRSGHGFWLDLDGNFERGPEEPLTNANMMAVVTVPVPGNAADGSKKEGRLVVIADGDFVTDQVIRNPGNSFVLNDILKWMLGEEEIVSVAASEEDIPIEHTREEDKVWFYATTVGVPLIPLAFGIAVALRRRRKPKKRKTTKPSNPEEVKS